MATGNGHVRSRAAPASAEEAAAIVAAIERFMRDHAPAAFAGAQAPLDGWHTAALLEGVRRGQTIVAAHPWINT